MIDLAHTFTPYTFTGVVSVSVYSMQRRGFSDHVQKRVLFCLSFIGDSHGWREPRAGVVHAAFIPEGLFSRHSPIRNKRNDLGSETRLESIRSGGRYLGISEQLVLIINYAFLWV